MRSPAWLCLLSLTALVAAPAFAQDEEDLAPMPTKKPDAKPKAKPKAVPKAKPKPPPATAKKPVVEEDLAPMPVAKPGELLVKTTVANAVLSIDGKEIGALPSGAHPVPAGEHTVLVKRAGYANFVKKVTVIAGKTLEVEAKLAPVMAVLSVSSDVAGAQVFVDGKLIGSAPISDYELPAKPVELAVRKEGYREDKRTLTLFAGKDYPVAVKFTPATTTTLVARSDRPVETLLTPPTRATSPVTTVTAGPDTPIYGKWYFWAGVAAVVAAGATTAIVVSNSQPPRKLGEKDICTKSGGVCDACIGLSCSVSAAVPW